VSAIRDAKEFIMLVNAVKASDKLNLSSMPTHIETPNEGELPIEVVLAILYTQAKRLESEALAQVLTGLSPKGERVTYIRMTGIIFDAERGFVLAEPLPTDANTANTVKNETP
jgi:hypothetical protein